MIRRRSGKRIAFIDGQNLHQSFSRSGYTVDYRRLRLLLKQRYLVDDAIIYLGFIKENRKMYDYLRRSGFKLSFKEVTRHNGKVKGNVDVDLVVDALVRMKNYGGAVVMTGDGDFLALMNYLGGVRKLVKVISPARNGCSGLIRRKLKKNLEFLEDYAGAFLKGRKPVSVPCPALK